METQSKNEESSQNISNSRNRPEIKKEDLPENNDVEILLKNLIPHFEYNIITYTKKYAIEIKHKTKNIRYVLEVDRSNLMVIFNGKDRINIF